MCEERTLVCVHIETASGKSRQESKKGFFCHQTSLWFKLSAMNMCQCPKQSRHVAGPLQAGVYAADPVCIGGLRCRWAPHSNTARPSAERQGVSQHAPPEGREALLPLFTATATTRHRTVNKGKVFVGDSLDLTITQRHKDSTHNFLKSFIHRFK